MPDGCTSVTAYSVQEGVAGEDPHYGVWMARCEIRGEITLASPVGPDGNRSLSSNIGNSGGESGTSGCAVARGIGGAG